MAKVGVIGLGPVGATIAARIMQKGVATELVLIDLNVKKAQSEVIDLKDSSSLLAHYTNVYVGTYEDLSDADVVISALGNISAALESGDRFAELKSNVPAVRSVASSLKKVGFIGKVLVATNPNDVLTKLFADELNLPDGSVFGTGCLLDTMRMQHYVSEVLNVNSRSVEGYVIGEHGPTQVVAWSTVNIGGKNINEYASEFNIDFAELELKIKVGGFSVVSGKGFTNVAIAESTTHILDAILTDAKTILPVSSYHKNHDVFISSPAVVGKKGVEKILDLRLVDDEQVLFNESVKTIQEQQQQIK